MIELVHPTDNEDYVIFAQDIELLKKINFRFGSKVKETIFGYSFGLGLVDANISGNNRMSIDYAVVISNYLFKDIHSISVSFNR